MMSNTRQQVLLAAAVLTALSFLPINLSADSGYKALQAQIAQDERKALPMLREWSADMNGEQRALAAWGFGHCKTLPDPDPALLKLAADLYVPCRAAAMFTLGRFDHAEARPHLQAGLNDANQQVRLATVRGMAKGSAALHRLLTPRLAYEIRQEPVKEGSETLQEVVYWTEPDAAVRIAIVQTLRQLQAVDAVPTLIAAMEREESFSRLIIMEAIAGFGPRVSAVCLGRIVPTPYDKTSFQTRMPLLINNGTLAVLAGRLGDRRCVPHLLKTLELPRSELGKDKDLTQLYIDSIEQLGRYKVDQASRQLAELLKESKLAQLSEAIQVAVRAIGRPAARHLARQADDWELCQIFLPLLRLPDMHTRAVRDTLLRFAQHESDDVRIEAARTLGLYLYEGVLDEYDVGVLEQMARDANPSVRQLCATWKIKINEKYGADTMR